MNGALDDVVVLDLTRSHWASLSTVFLGDFGARVIRLDLGPREDAPPGGGAGGKAAWDFEADLFQRNKQSIAIDPAEARGRELLGELVGKADVFVSDWPLGELEALGLDYASAQARRGDLVYARGSGFGPKGPDKDLPAIDELAAARTGMMPILPQPGQPPVYTGAGAMHTAVQLSFGVVVALLHRGATGEGQAVDVSLFAGNLYGASLDVQAFLAIGSGDRLLNPISRLDVSNPMSPGLYPAADGRWVTLTMPDTDRWWPALAEALGLDPADDRFDSHDKRCETNRLELIEVFDQAFAKQPSDHWRRIFQEKQMSADIIEQCDYPAHDPQAFRNRYLLALDHPSFGRVKSLGFPIFMSESPARLESLAPCVGQHSAQVLRDLLEYGEDDIYALTEQRVIA